MIVGVAGHVDHGKTSLVAALTGVDTDRLPEEKARGLTIEPGFAYLPVPDGPVIGFVDMPGHERFMRAMIAGASGIDLLLLVIAADDGIMPQTSEHLAVARLMGITQAVVAVTKADLVTGEPLARRIAEIGAWLAEQGFAGAPVHAVSARSGAGFAPLRDTLFAAAGRPAPGRPGPLRFSIDRSFTISGAGTVITGVVVQGEVRVGDRLVLSPSGREARIRSIRAQDRPAERGLAGQRCGLALGGAIAAEEVARGDWLLAPMLHAPVRRVDARLHLLGDCPGPLRHWSEVRVHHGAAEVAARVALLQQTPLAPGEVGFVQLVCDHPLAAAAGDAFVLRAADGRRTLGGGRLVDLAPPARRRRQPRRLDQLEAMALAGAEESLVARCGRWPFFVEEAAFLRERALDPAATGEIARLGLVRLGAGPAALLVAQDVLAAMEARLLAQAAAFHRAFPQLLGPSLARLRSGAGIEAAALAAAAVAGLVAQGRLAREGGAYRLPSHRLDLDRADLLLWKRIVPLLDGEARFRPPLLPELAQTLGARDFDCRRVLRHQARQGAVAEVAPGRFFLRSTLGEIAAIVAQIAAAAPDGLFGAAELRDRLANGRKVAIEVLEYLDREGITGRRGDLRLLVPERLREWQAAG